MENEVVATERVYSSRKFVLAIICIVVIFLGGLLAVKFPAFAALYPAFIGGVLGVAGLYITGNVTNDFLNNKTKANIEVEHIKVTGTTIKEAASSSQAPQLSQTDLNQIGE